MLTRNASPARREALARPASFRQPRLADMIARELRDDILAGRYRDGDWLPPQEDLVAQFGVSAPSIREALRVLEAEGLVTVQRGKVGGAVVHEPRAGKVAYMLGLVLQQRAVALQDVSETLSRLDPVCAARCAELRGRSRTVVPLLRANLRESRKAVDDPVRYAPLARTFHELLVSNCGSETLSLVVGSLESLWSGHVSRLSSPKDPDRPATTLSARRASLAEHEQLVELIAAGDADGAGRLARRHLTSHDDLSYSFSTDVTVQAETVREIQD